MVEQITDVDAVLDQRETTYGSYSAVARLSQRLKHCFTAGDSYHKLTPEQKESLDMIASKLARIVNGNPEYVDSWVDVAGYAQLIVERLRNKEG